MGFFSNRQIEILTLHSSGVSMINIAAATGATLQEVMDVIDNDPDYGPWDDAEDPSAYAEHSADLDADFYATA